MTTLAPTTEKTRLPLTLDSNAASKAAVTAAKVFVAAAGAPEAGNSVEDWLAHLAAQGAGVHYFSDTLPDADTLPVNSIAYLANAARPGFRRVAEGGYQFVVGHADNDTGDEFGVYISHADSLPGHPVFGSVISNWREYVNYAGFLDHTTSQTQVHVSKAAWEAIVGRDTHLGDTFYVTIAIEGGASQRAQFTHAPSIHEMLDYVADNGIEYIVFRNTNGTILDAAIDGTKFTVAFERDDATAFWVPPDDERYWVVLPEPYATQSYTDYRVSHLEDEIDNATASNVWTNTGNIAGGGVTTELDLEKATMVNVWHKDNNVWRSYSVSARLIRGQNGFTDLTAFPAHVRQGIGGSSEVRLGYDQNLRELWIGPATSGGSISIAAGSLKVEVLGV